MYLKYVARGASVKDFFLPLGLSPEIVDVGF